VASVATIYFHSFIISDDDDDPDTMLAIVLVVLLMWQKYAAAQLVRQALPTIAMHAKRQLEELQAEEQVRQVRPRKQYDWARARYCLYHDYWGPYPTFCQQSVRS